MRAFQDNYYRFLSFKKQLICKLLPLFLLKGAVKGCELISCELTSCELMSAHHIPYCTQNRLENSSLLDASRLKFLNRKTAYSPGTTARKIINYILDLSGLLLYYTVDRCRSQLLDISRYRTSLWYNYQNHGKITVILINGSLGRC